MKTKVEKQHRIMWILSDLQLGDDDILIKEEFYNLLNVENYNYDDWVLEFDDLEAIKFYLHDKFKEHLDYKYHTED